MQETRRARLASVIREEISLMLRTIKDPRVPMGVCINQVDVVEDGSQATLLITILGGHEDRAKVKDCLEGLTSASGYLRRHLAKILTVRHIPNLIFKEDKGLDNATRVYELLKQIDTSSKE